MAALKVAVSTPVSTSEVSLQRLPPELVKNPTQFGLGLLIQCAGHWLSIVCVMATQAMITINFSRADSRRQNPIKFAKWYRRGVFLNNDEIK